MVKCYLHIGRFDIPLKKSNEHILLNCIGGNEESDSLICEECNHKYGGSIERKLCNTFKPFMALLDIKRDRGKVGTVEFKGLKTSKKYLFENDSFRFYSPEDVENNGVIQIRASSEKKFIEFLNKYRKKYPSLDLHNAIDNSKWQKAVIDERLNFKISFDIDCLRVITKMATNVYMHFGGDAVHIIDVVRFIRAEVENDFINYFYPKTEIIIKEPDQILHSVVIVGDNKQKILYSYIELFNAFRFIVILNDNYLGEFFSKDYIYDPESRKKADFKPNLRFSKEEIISQIKFKKTDITAMTSEITKLQNIITKRTQQRSKKQSFSFGYEEDLNNTNSDKIDSALVSQYVERYIAELKKSGYFDKFIYK